jgi:hypothetical protein
MVEEVGVAGTVEGGVERKHEEEDVGDISQPVLGQRFAFSRYREWCWATYRVLTRGIILPVLRVSTSRMKGMIERMLWCDEKGVSQCTARLRIHTTNTGRLMGRIHSMRIRIEWV